MADVPRLHTQSKMSPLVDVLLVLLIMFLCSVQLSQEGIDVFLPGENNHGDGDAQIVVEYSADRLISVNRQVVPASELGTRLHQIYRRRRDKTMWLSAAGSLRYGEVMAVIDAAKSAGVGQVGVITPGTRQR
ncbi:MAG: biopolymer transporter ExbD [Vicinamibacterales bacterium]